MSRFLRSGHGTINVVLLQGDYSASREPAFEAAIAAIREGQ
jgi:hypothetical protein